MKAFLLTCFLLAAVALAAADENFHLPGKAPGAFESKGGGGVWVFANGAISAIFEGSDARLHLRSLRNNFTGETLAWNDPDLFTLQLPSGPLASTAMILVGPPEVVPLKAESASGNLARRSPGKALTATFSDTTSGIQVVWSAVFREGSNYFRQELVVTSTKPVEVKEIQMIHAALPGSKVAGYTDGAPIVCGNWFMGLEHPMAKNAVNTAVRWTPDDMAANRITRELTDLKPGPCTVKFSYQSGNHGITISKVALVADGKVIAEDTHPGFSGHATRQNEYTLQVPAGVSTSTLRATLTNEPGQYDGWGGIALTNGTLASGSHASASLPRGFALAPGNIWSLSTQFGAAPEGQLRRAFAYYLQRERAHPYRQYWHYNSWYDLNINRNDLDDPIKRMNEGQCLEVIAAFDRNLYQRHKVGLNGFVWDDGWDDWNTLWGFHQGFPNGFKELNAAAKSQGAQMGAWLSPWGGYGRSHNMRVEFGKMHGYEVNSGGLSLGGPKYRAVFRDTCLKMIRDYQQDYFKFDGIGGGVWSTGAPPAISADLDGLISVTRDLRQANPAVFINCTVGTWASPYWMCFADSVWRQGADTAFAGKGNPRERWINYKDGIVLRRFAGPSPLFPMNSLMYHGLVLGPVGDPAKMPTPAQNLGSFRHEVRMMAGYASGLGELYVTPSLMTDEAWAILAECIQWTRTNQVLLADSHWIGGDPERGEIYGFAAWHPEKGGVITLRNPDDQVKSITLDLTKTWELPATVTGEFDLRSPWQADAGKPPGHASVSQALTLTLQPFEVLTLQSLTAR